MFLAHAAAQAVKPDFNDDTHRIFPSFYVIFGSELVKNWRLSVKEGINIVSPKTDHQLPIKPGFSQPLNTGNYISSTDNDAKNLT